MNGWPMVPVARSLLLMLLCAPWGCANFDQAERDFCQDNPKCTPADTNTSTPGVSQAAGGESFSLVLMSDQSVWAFGRNTSGQLGDGTTKGRANAKPVTGLSNITKIAAGSEHALAMGNGHVYAWGKLDSYTVQTTPVIVSGQTDITEIAAGRAYSLGLRRSHSVSIWGSNDSLQASPTPSDVPGLSDIQHIAAGSDHALAVDGDGVVWAWGDNESYQLGNESYGGGTTPVKVKGLPSISRVAAGLRHSLALDVDGGVWAWGDNSAGQLGDGTTDGPRATPVRVGGLQKITSLTAGAAHSLAMTPDGNLMAWGSDLGGQLGDGDTHDKPTPVQISKIKNAQSIAAGFAHSLEVGSRGELFVWGNNEAGETGPSSPGGINPLPVSISFPAPP